MSLKLNSISNSIFSAENVGNVDIAVNGTTLSRKGIVATGRLVACEYIGQKLNERPNVTEKYNEKLSRKDFADIEKAHGNAKFMFCAAQAYKAVGKEPPASVEEAKRDLSLATNEIFLATMAAIDRDILQPIIFHVYDDIGAGGLMQWEAVQYGATKEIEIRSNDVFLFEDSSWGSARSASYNYLYDKTITLNPKPYQCNAKIKWYREIINGNYGAYYAAIMNGMWNKIYAVFMSKLKTAASNTAYIPSGLKASTYTTSNWNTITTKIAAVNGVRRSDLLAFGGINQLANVLPTDGTGGAMVGLQYGLGEEWFRRGYLPNAAGIQLLEVTPVVVPGTQNSSIDTIDTGNSIFITAKGGYGYAPIYGAYFEGSPLTLELSVRETRDMTIDVNVTAMFDFAPVFASKVGVITDVVSNE